MPKGKTKETRMSKVLYLIRHAKSSWADPSLDDFDRPLNQRGLRDAPFMARLLAGQGIKADALISSPALRTMTTAHYFAKALQYSPEQIIPENRLYEAASWEVLEIIRQLKNEWNTVLLFGHNPSMTSVANQHSENYIANVPTCGICRLEADVSNWDDWNQHRARLTDFYYPKQYFT